MVNTMSTKENTMAHAADLVGLLLQQTGDRYVFGQEVSADDPSPDTFD
jgi:hypothetical protein